MSLTMAAMADVPSSLPTPSQEALRVVVENGGSSGWPPQAIAVVVAAGAALLGVILTAILTRRAMIAAEDRRHQNSLDAEDRRHQNSLDAEDRRHQNALNAEGERHRYALELDRQQRLAVARLTLYADLEDRRLALNATVTRAINFRDLPGSERDEALARLRAETAVFAERSGRDSLLASREVQMATRRVRAQCFLLQRPPRAGDEPDRETQMLIKTLDVLDELERLLRLEVGVDPAEEWSR